VIKKTAAAGFLSAKKWPCFGGFTCCELADHVHRWPGRHASLQPLVPVSAGHHCGPYQSKDLEAVTVP
jgi:hypothetical protein